MMKNLNNFIFSFLINIFVFIIILYNIWFRYLRPRLTKNIPFHLSLLTLISLSIICLSFIFIIKRIIKPKPDSITQTVIIPSIIRDHSAIIEAYRESISYLDNLFRNLLIVKKTINMFAAPLRFLFWERSVNTRLMVYFCIMFLPKIFIALIFFIDVFIISKISLFYMVIPLGLIPLAFSYLIHCIRESLESHLQFLEEYYEVDIIRLRENPEFDTLEFMHPDGDFKYSIRNFLDMQVFSSHQELIYKCTIRWNVVFKYFPEIMGDINDIDKEHKDIMEKDFYKFMPIARDMYNFLCKYDLLLQRFETTVIAVMARNVTVIILGIYLIGWLYIVLISLPSFHLTDFDLKFLKDFQMKLNPFSDINNE